MPGTAGEHGTTGTAPVVAFFYRARAKGYSIQRLFADIRSALPDRFRQREWFAPTADARPGSILRDVRTVRREQGDINHVTGDVTYLALGLDPARTVITFHDVYHLRHGLAGRPLARLLFRMLWVWLPLRRCAAAVAISEQTKADLVRYGGADPASITVIPDCYSPDLNPAPRPFHAERPRLLIVGTDVNKNVPAMVRALEGLAVHVRIIGELTPAIRRAIDETGVEVSNEAGLSDPEMSAEYERADALLFATLREGFGMPIIEAQAVGRPVLTSALPPMEEVAGGAAILVDPQDVASIRAGIHRLLEDAGLRARLIEDGFRNAARYTSERVAAAYAEVYDRVLVDVEA